MGAEFSTVARSEVLKVKLSEVKEALITSVSGGRKGSPYTAEQLEKARRAVASLKAYTPEFHGLPADKESASRKDSRTCDKNEEVLDDSVFESESDQETAPNLPWEQSSPDAELDGPSSYDEMERAGMYIERHQNTIDGPKTIYRDANGKFGFELLAGLPEEGIKVYSVLDGSPAHLAGVQVGSTIVEVDGVDIVGMSYAEINEILMLSGDVIYARFLQPTDLSLKQPLINQDDLENLAALKLQQFFKAIIQRKRLREQQEVKKDREVPTSTRHMISTKKKSARKPAKKRPYRDPLYDKVIPRRTTESKRMNATRSVRNGKKPSQPVDDMSGKASDISVSLDQSNTENDISKIRSVSASRDLTAIFQENERDHSAHAAQLQLRRVSFKATPEVFTIYDDEPTDDASQSLSDSVPAAVEEKQAESGNADDAMLAAEEFVMGNPIVGGGWNSIPVESNFESYREDYTPTKEDLQEPTKTTTSSGISITKREKTTTIVPTKTSKAVEVVKRSTPKEHGVAIKITGSKVHSKLMGTYVELEGQFGRVQAYCKFDKDGKPYSYFYYRDKSWKISKSLGKQQCAISTTSPATRPDKAKSIWYEARGPNGKAMQGHPGISCVLLSNDAPTTQVRRKLHMP